MYITYTSIIIIAPFDAINSCYQLLEENTQKFPNFINSKIDDDEFETTSDEPLSEEFAEEYNVKLENLESTEVILLC
jgi:hypothetical protein